MNVLARCLSIMEWIETETKGGMEGICGRILYKANSVDKNHQAHTHTHQKTGCLERGSACVASHKAEAIAMHVRQIDRTRTCAARNKARGAALLVGAPLVVLV